MTAPIFRCWHDDFDACQAFRIPSLIHIGDKESSMYTISSRKRIPASTCFAAALISKNTGNLAGRSRHQHHVTCVVNEFVRHDSATIDFLEPFP